MRKFTDVAGLKNAALLLFQHKTLFPLSGVLLVRFLSLVTENEHKKQFDKSKFEFFIDTKTGRSFFESFALFLHGIMNYISEYSL